VFGADWRVKKHDKVNCNYVLASLYSSYFFQKFNDLDVRIRGIGVVEYKLPDNEVVFGI